MTDPNPHRLKLNTAARIVAATLALAALIYTVTHILVDYRMEAYDKWGEQMELRLERLEEQTHPEKPKK